MTQSQLTELGNLLGLPITEVGIFDPAREQMGDEWPTSWVLYLRENPGEQVNLFSTPLTPHTLDCLECLNEWRRDLYEDEEESSPPPEITAEQRQAVAVLLPLLA